MLGFISAVRLREVDMVGNDGEVVKAIKEYFQKHPDLRWNFGGEVLNAHDTLKRIEKDKEFRVTLINAVVKYSIEQLVKGE